MPMPDMQPVSSSNIAAVGYDAENQTVYVQFLNGSTYAYKGVPEHEFENLRPCWVLAWPSPPLPTTIDLKSPKA